MGSAALGRGRPKASPTGRIIDRIFDNGLLLRAADVFGSLVFNDKLQQSGCP
jgi:hypothetical protein